MSAVQVVKPPIPVGARPPVHYPEPGVLEDWYKRRWRWVDSEACWVPITSARPKAIGVQD